MYSGFKLGSVVNGKWKKYHKFILENDGNVRKVQVEYKNTDSTTFLSIKKAVQRLVVILPIKKVVKQLVAEMFHSEINKFQFRIFVTVKWNKN